MATFVVSYKGASGNRYYAGRDGHPTTFERAARYETVAEARGAQWVSVTDTEARYWPVVEVWTDHETGAPFAWNVIPESKEAK